VTIANVPPTATFEAPATVFAGNAFTISLTNATDAAPADRPCWSSRSTVGTATGCSAPRRRARADGRHGDDHRPREGP
jgi:hypothetical protein